MKEAGIESVVDSVFSIFLTEIPRRMEALENAVRDGKLLMVEQEAHALKSGSRNLRADAFGDLLEAMELAGNEGDLARAQELLPGVQEEFRSVVDYLNGLGFRPE